jgi:hypothetical protein
VKVVRCSFASAASDRMTAHEDHPMISVASITDFLDFGFMTNNTL